MARVIWDGEKIVVDSSRLDTECLDALSAKYGGERLPLSDFYQFPRSRETIMQIGALSGIVMDPSFEKLYSKVVRSEERKETELRERIAGLDLPGRMYVFQKEAVVTMLDYSDNGRNVLLASAPGCGKSCMTSVYLSKKAGAYPCLLICPASLKTNWAMEIQKWSPGVKTYILEGRSSYEQPSVVASAKNADVVITNYDILGIEDKTAREKEEMRIAEAKENGRKYRKAFIPVKGWAGVFAGFGFRTVVCDECQYIESSKAVRTRAVIQICSDKRIRKVFLSGTPFETKLKQFYNACHILAPDLFPKESEFLFRYCAPKKTYFGWTFDGVSNLEELRRKLSLFMIRHRKEDVLSQLPAKQKIPVYFGMNASSRKLYDDMEEELMSRKDKMHQFSYIAEMRKALMEIKKEVVYQYVKDMLEVEGKIVVFVYHVGMYDFLMEKFKGIAVGINGSVAAVKRQAAVDKFQKTDKIRLFIGQIGAVSTGLTLTASHTLIFAEFGQTAAQMEQASDRIHRIGQESDSCQIYYLVLKDTIDEAPIRTLSSHYTDIDKVMDGGSGTEFVDFGSQMMAWVKDKRLMRQKKGISIEYE